jgi:hypothetical protein
VFGVKGIGDTDGEAVLEIQRESRRMVGGSALSVAVKLCFNHYYLEETMLKERVQEMARKSVPLAEAILEATLEEAGGELDYQSAL